MNKKKEQNKEAIKQPVKLQVSNAELQVMLEENLRLNREILEAVKSIRGYVRWQRVWSLVRWLIILVPIILGFIYLPPLFKQLVAEYQKLLGLGSSVQDISNEVETLKSGGLSDFFKLIK